jgi:Mn2+/Fe2+ NRAMP family transporter
MSGIILQKACGNIPLSMFFMALCTSSLAAETPRIMYRLLEFIVLYLVIGLYCCVILEFGEVRIWPDIMFPFLTFKAKCPSK